MDSVCRIQAEVAGRLRAAALGADAVGAAAPGAATPGAAGVVLDLADVTDIDSTAVSLLLHWQRDARAAGRTLLLRNPPANLTSLASLYGVEDFLPQTAV
ncbi:STAS domain-containing protein [Chitinimonas koreensis]|nr:STAS domain-containing protein [Chitinimonas koreensis]